MLKQPLIILPCLSLLLLSAILMDRSSAYPKQIFEPSQDDIKDTQWDRFNNEGLPLWEMQNDLRVLANFYRWRYNKVLPVNFRVEFMTNITQWILNRMPDVKGEMKREIQLVYVTKFWFSNMAWFNHWKRWVKLYARQETEDIINQELAQYFTQLSKDQGKDPKYLLNSKTIDFNRNIVLKLMSNIQNRTWFNYKEIEVNAVKEALGQLEAWDRQINKNKGARKDLDLIKEYIHPRSKNEEEFLKVELVPFLWMDKKQKDKLTGGKKQLSLNQQHAYMIDYQLPDLSQKNSRVHPYNSFVHSSENSADDQINDLYFSWIKDAFNRCLHDGQKTQKAKDGQQKVSGERRFWSYVLVNSLVKNGAVEAFMNQYWKVYQQKNSAKEVYSYIQGFHKNRPVVKDLPKYFDKHSVPMDLELHDFDLDILTEQQKELEECLKDTDEGSKLAIGELLSIKQKYPHCYEHGTDLLTIDQDLIQREKEAHEGEAAHFYETLDQGARDTIKDVKKKMDKD